MMNVTFVSSAFLRARPIGQSRAIDRSQGIGLNMAASRCNERQPMILEKVARPQCADRAFCDGARPLDPFRLVGGGAISSSKASIILRSLTRGSCVASPGCQICRMRAFPIRGCDKFIDGLRSDATFADPQRDRCETVDAKHSRSTRAEVDHSSAHIRAAIVDSHRCGAAVTVVDDGDHAA